MTFSHKDSDSSLFLRAVETLSSSGADYGSAQWGWLARLIDDCERGILATMVTAHRAHREVVLSKLLKKSSSDQDPARSLTFSDALASLITSAPIDGDLRSGVSGTWSTFHALDGTERLIGALAGLIEVFAAAAPEAASQVLGDGRIGDLSDWANQLGPRAQSGRLEAFFGLVENPPDDSRSQVSGLSKISEYRLYGKRADLYDRLYERPGLYAAHADALEHHLGDRPRRVLDLACGTGQLIKELSTRGVSVVGVDISESMLDVALDRVPDGEFVHANMCDVRLEDKFDVVCCMFGAVHLLDRAADIEDVLVTAKYHLRSGGVAVFDVIDGARLPHAIVAGRRDGLEAYKAWAPARGANGADQYLLAARSLKDKEGFIEVQDYFYCSPDRIRRLAHTAGFRGTELVHPRAVGSIQHSVRGPDQVLLVCR